MTVAAPLQPEDTRAEEKRRARLDAVRAIVLSALGGLEAHVWLYGSFADRSERVYSDIDVAIDPSAPLPAGFLIDLHESLERSTVPRTVHVVDLSGADAEFAETVRRKGILWSG
ncbi:MAG: nucleotidyltransferase domain-containing protein [Rhodospirillaceae bacterium]|nr:nucleotidyltransferase domain-containing protein [Rhodospirillaceae bacterium]MYF08253.1 nucleotidyltransferase domain-containing protein [Rhodospirillaceae bacterium]MYJ71325.1 nucleotidyltransferase domain-containing protein [Rhodospirillaceae bacterium]